MFSKPIQNVCLGALLAGSVLSGCSKYFRSAQETEAQNAKIQVQAKAFLCLKTIGDQLRDFLQDQADVTEVNQIFSCIDGAVVQFDSFTTGQSSTEYTNNELRTFANRYLALKNQMSEDFMRDILKIKAFLVGGSPETMTRVEMKNLRVALRTLNSIALNLRGHGKTIMLTADRSTISDAIIDETLALVKSSLRQILASSQATQSTYVWSDFESFTRHLAEFAQSKDLLVNLDRYFPLSDSVRLLFLGEETSRVSLEDWIRDSDWTAEAYGLVARYFYLVRDLDHDTPSSWLAFMHFGDQGLALLAHAPQMVKGKLLVADSIDKVIDQLETLKLLPETLPSSTLKEAYKQILAHLIQNSHGVHVDVPVVRGLEMRDLSVIEFEFNVWKIAQLSLIKGLEDQKSLPMRSVSQRVAQMKLATLMQNMKIGTEQIDTYIGTWNDWQQTLKFPHPVSFTPQWKEILGGRGADEPLSISGFTAINCLRTLARLLMLGYGTPRNGRMGHIEDNTLSLGGMQSWYGDFHSLLRSLNLMDPRARDKGKRIFDDARFFSFHGDGSEHLSQAMIMEELSMMLSGGLGVTAEWMTVLKTDGCWTNQRDSAFNKPLIDTKCLKSSFQQRYSSLFQNLPGFVAEVKSGKLPFDEMFSEIRMIGALSGNPFETTEYAELRQMAVVLHYVESLLEVYDANRDQALNQTELMNAFPRFQAIIEALSPMGHHASDQAFLYVAVRGDLPETDGFWNKLKAGVDFGLFELSGEIKPIRRSNLLKVISLLKAKTSVTVAPQ